MVRTAILAMVALAPAITLGSDRYVAPEGCMALATLRLPNCLVRHVSSCPAGNVMDSFADGLFVGRSYFDHPSLFVRFEGVDGRVVGHDYGATAPEPGTQLETGATYTYSRDVYRDGGPGEPGDTGTEVMTVGPELGLTLDGRTYRVLDIRFTVRNPDTGYDYRERALMLLDPPLSLGALGTSVDADGTVTEGFSTVPESMSLRGDPGFGSMEPVPSCHVSS